MNEEKLLSAFSEIGDDLILEAEKAPIKSRKKPKFIILAAAIILLFSVTAVATEFFTSFEQLYWFAPVNLGEYETIVNDEVYDEESGLRFTLSSSLADDRVCLLLWQIKNTKGNFSEKSLVTTDILVNGRINPTSIHWIAGYPQNIIVGEELIQTFGGKKIEGKISVDEIYYCESTGEILPEDKSEIYREVEYVKVEKNAEGSGSRLEINFTVDKIMESIELETKDINTKIQCSPISMLIDGNLPEYKNLVIVFEDGSSVSGRRMLRMYGGWLFCFDIPLDPNEIVSILYNGEELLR